MYKVVSRYLPAHPYRLVFDIPRLDRTNELYPSSSTSLTTLSSLSTLWSLRCVNENEDVFLVALSYRLPIPIIVCQFFFPGSVFFLRHLLTLPCQSFIAFHSYREIFATPFSISIESLKGAYHSHLWATLYQFILSFLSQHDKLHCLKEGQNVDT